MSPQAKQTLLDAIGQIRAAQTLLLDASRSMSSIEDLIKINTEYTHLDSFLSQILHAVGVADDAQFKQATGALKAQVGTLTADIESINKVIKNVATAGKIAGFLAKAVQLIGTV